MDIDWNLVKKITLWSYEDLVKKLQETLAFTFVQEHYNHTLVQAGEYTRKICAGYLQNKGDVVVYIEGVRNTFKDLESWPQATYIDLIARIDSREKCTAFLQQTGLEFERLITLLNYLLRWVLPFKIPVREFIADDEEEEIAYLESLKRQKLTSNLVLLETGRTRAGRENLVMITGIPVEYINRLVHRCDISRLAYVRGKTVKHLCGGGYDTLEKLARAQPDEMEARMTAYYQSIGKRLEDFKLVIPLVYMAGGARILPRIMEKD